MQMFQWWKQGNSSVNWTRIFQLLSFPLPFGYLTQLENELWKLTFLENLNDKNFDYTQSAEWLDLKLELFI